MAKNLTIVKKNDLIENFIFNATLMELQILNYAVTMVDPFKENEGIRYDLDIKQIANLFNTKSKSIYEDYKAALKRLLKRTFSYVDNSGKVRTSNIVETTIHKDEDEFLSVIFTRYVEARLQQLRDNFTSYSIDKVSMFNSRYGYMLYELFLMYLNKCKKSSVLYRIKVKTLKTRLNLTSNYKLFNDFKRRVIHPALDDINNHSDLIVDYEVERKGKTPVDFIFKIKYKSLEDEISKIEKDSNYSNAMQDLIMAGFNETRAKDLILNFGTQKCIDATRLTLKKSEKGSNIENIPAFITGVLVNSKSELAN